MPLVFAAIVPHTPLLIPAIAKDHHRLLAATRQSVFAVAQELYASQPDTLIILSPHGPSLPKTFVIQVADKLTGRLVEFGDLATEITVRGAIEAAHRLRELAEDHQVPMTLQTVPNLDYGSTVPLTFLTSAPQVPRVLPITVADCEVETAIFLGRILQELFQGNSARIAIIASADLTRRSATASQSERRPSPEERAIAESFTELDPARLATVVPQAGTCGYLPILTMIGALQGQRARGVVRSFEAPVNVGMLVGTVDFSA